MVVYDLICKKKHKFEGWFPSAEGYEKQAEGKQISCPTCGTTQIVKLLHACAIHTKKEVKKDSPRSKKAPEVRLSETEAKEVLLRLNHYVRENFEDVGPRFAEEARKMVSGQEDKKSIYGTVTPEERKGLDEDEVPYAVLPKPELDS